MKTEMEAAKRQSAKLYGDGIKVRRMVVKLFHGFLILKMINYYRLSYPQFIS